MNSLSARRRVPRNERTNDACTSAPLLRRPLRHKSTSRSSGGSRGKMGDLRDLAALGFLWHHHVQLRVFHRHFLFGSADVFGVQFLVLTLCFRLALDLGVLVHSLVSAAGRKAIVDTEALMPAARHRERSQHVCAAQWLLSGNTKAREATTWTECATDRTPRGLAKASGERALQGVHVHIRRLLCSTTPP